jgi:hypothetical protein
MPQPLLDPKTKVTANDHWNPLVVQANLSEAELDAIQGGTMAAGGISNISTVATAPARLTALETAPVVGRAIGRGSRATAAGVANSLTFVGALRIDSLAMTAGRLYRVETNTLLAAASAVSNQILAHIRYSSSGAATTASTVLPGTEGRTVPVAGNGGTFVGPVRCSSLFVPGSTGTYSFLLCYRRETGTGTVNLDAGGDRLITLAVFDLGVAPADTGVAI